MNENPDRVDQFQAEIEAMKLRASGAENETRLLAVGVLMAVVGLGLAVYGGIQVSADSNEFNQRAFMATGSFIGIAMLIAGVGLFLRYSLARYLRFWLIRLVHESRANTDRIVDAIDRAAGPPPPMQ